MGNLRNTWDGWCGELPLVAESDGGQLFPWRSDRTTREQLSPVPCCPAPKYGSLAVRTHESPSPTRSCAMPSKNSAPRTRRRQRIACGARDRDLSVPPASRRSDPLPVRSARGAQNENAAPSGAVPKAARDRARPQPRSAFRSHPSCMRTRKKAGTGEGSCPIARQNSSIAPGTVCTMRLARCAGSAL